MASKRIEKIIAKYLINQASFEELDKLEAWIIEPNNEKDFLNYVKVNYSIDYNLRTTDINKTKELISTLIKKEKRQIRVRRIQRYSKYSAIFIGVMISIYIFKDDLFKSSNKDVVVPTIVNTTIIEPGTDKATLTLANGEQVPLEKGTSFQTQNASSNGEEIVYEAGNRKTKELVYNYLTIPRGGQFYLVLSDGTKVWLNSESQLKYPVNFLDGETRQVELVYGEAYFDVSPSTAHDGSKFKVHNKEQDVKVLGTEFNIKAYQDESIIYTTLVEGKVEVNTSNDRIKTLLPNEQLNFNSFNNNISISSGVDLYSIIAWKDGVFSFRSKPLKEIMKVISRWYDTEVIFNDVALENVTFNGSLDKKLNIEEILSIIGSTNNIEYEINDKTIILK